jgi:NADH-quinone oxidoreductase subunit M
VILSLGSVALPLTNGFIGEFLLLKSVFDQNLTLGIVAGITIILGAVYTLRLIQKSMFGNVSRITSDFADLLRSIHSLGSVMVFVLKGYSAILQGL